MAVLKLEAFLRLEEVLAVKVPALAGRIHVKQAPGSQELVFPSLVIDPVRWKYFPDQASPAFYPTPEVEVLNVGRHEATVQLRLSCATLHDRYELEQELTNVFLADDEMRPGILLTTVSSCPELGAFIAAWELDEDGWQDEMAFESQHNGMCTLTGTLPALVVNPERVYSINDLRVGLTADLITALSSGTFDTSSAVDVVRINEDGSLTPL